jgi:hypothetical protein
MRRGSELAVGGVVGGEYFGGKLLPKRMFWRRDAEIDDNR